MRYEAARVAPAPAPHSPQSCEQDGQMEVAGPLALGGVPWEGMVKTRRPRSGSGRVRCASAGREAGCMRGLFQLEDSGSQF